MLNMDLKFPVYSNGSTVNFTVFCIRCDEESLTSPLKSPLWTSGPLFLMGNESMDLKYSSRILLENRVERVMMCNNGNPRQNQTLLCLSCVNYDLECVLHSSRILQSTIISLLEYFRNLSDLPQIQKQRGNNRTMAQCNILVFIYQSIL